MDSTQKMGICHLNQNTQSKIY